VLLQNVSEIASLLLTPTQELPETVACESVTLIAGVHMLAAFLVG